MPPGDDDRDAASYSSPACLLHEVDPAYAGYMTDAEVLALLKAVYAETRAWPAGVTRFAALLERHIKRLGGTPDAGSAPLRDDAGGLSDLLQRALPRIVDPVLHAELKAMLAAWTHRG